MEQCYTCRRQLGTIRSVITVDAVSYCSEICRQKHRGKTVQEKQKEKRQDRRSALWKGGPLIVVGSILLLVPLALMIYLTLASGGVRLFDLVGGVFYLIPGGAILAIGLYNYREHAPRASRH
jgi:hypothetical protein